MTDLQTPLGLSIEERARYARQMLLPDIGAVGQLRLKRARVLIVGAGGLGSPVGLYLAAAGVGTLGLLDFDTVHVSNLHRQVLYTTDDVGCSKAEAAARRLTALNPAIHVEAIDRVLDAETALEIVRRYDLVVDGTDNFTARYLVNDSCVMNGIPYIYASIFRHEGLLAIFAATNGPCYRCIYPEPPPPELAPSCADGGVLGVLPGVIGLLQATEAVKLILGLGDPMVGRILQYDALAMRFREYHVTKDPHCPICAPEGLLRGRPISPIVAACLTPPAAAPASTISSRELLARINKGEAGCIVDVRSIEESRADAITGSICIPLSQFETRIAELPRDTQIVCYCLSGVRSKCAVQLLAAAGLPGALSLEGGILMWDPSALSAPPD